MTEFKTKSLPIYIRCQYNDYIDGNSDAPLRSQKERLLIEAQRQAYEDQSALGDEVVVEPERYVRRH